MELFGNPQNYHPTIHVAGTSGKGTICYLVDAILRTHSKRTGMTQSPHVYDIRERIQVNGQLISERQFLRALNKVLTVTHQNGIQVSYFETLTAMGYITLGQAPLDYVVIETGFGGRLDATNVVSNPKKVCVLGQIGLDHTEALGDTVAKIAAEKAGIVQPHNLVIALRQAPEVNAVFESRCQEQNATLLWVEPGAEYQETNNKIALAVCRTLAERDHWQFDPALATAVLEQVFIPGRFEKRRYRDHLVILDGAHNPQKLTALAKRVTREQKNPATFIMAIGERKDITGCIRALQPVAKRILTTEYFTDQQDIPKRPTPANEVVQLCKELGIDAQAALPPQRALQIAAEYPEPIIATGSFYLLTELDTAF